MITPLPDSPDAQVLPDYPEDMPSVAAYQNMTALEKFVYDWQPGGRPDEWRKDLTAVIEVISAQRADDVWAALESCVEAMEMKQRVTMWGRDGDLAKFNIALEAARRALKGKP